MRGLSIPRRWRVQGVSLVCLLWLAGCGSKPVHHDALVRAGAATAPQAATAAAPPPLPSRIDVVDGNGWTHALAVVTRSLQQAALSNGEVEVMRMADNRLRVRIDAADALDRRGETLQPDFRRFIENMAEILAPYPSVQVQVIGYSRAPQAAATKQALTWARSSLRVLATHGVGAERLTARARSALEPEPGRLPPPGRCIEFLLSDPLVR
jgi:flagellar motor protein MotB